MAPLKSIVLVCLMVLLIPCAPQARTSLVALPMQDTVHVNLGNPAAALVTETRVLTFQKGKNQVDFSWQGVHIDPDSIQITLLTSADRATVISVSFPPDQDALTWEVFSQDAMEAKVRISYLLSGIDRLIAYKAVADQEETAVNLESYLVLRNFSGEDFENAAFIITGREAFSGRVSHEETKRIKFFHQLQVPVNRLLTWDAATMPHEPDKLDYTPGIPMTYTMTNTKASGLGDHPLSGGKARVFQEDGHTTHIFLGEDLLEFTPVGEKAALKIADSRDVSVTRHRVEQKRLNIVSNKDGAPQVYDENIHDRLRIKNFKNAPVTLEIIEHIEGEWEPVKFSEKYTRESSSRLVFTLELEAGESREINMHYRVKNIFAGAFSRFNKVRQ